MKKLSPRVLCLIFIASLLVGCATKPTPTPKPTQTVEVAPPPTSTTSAKENLSAGLAPTTAPIPGADPFSLISQDSLFAFLEDLTAIQPYSGWRNSASEGEAEALDYVTQKLEGLDYLNELGLELEHQKFRVFLGTELWETRLHLTVDGQETEVPADGLRGPRDNIGQALRFDSDGALNDTTPNPQVAEGSAVLIRSADEIYALEDGELAGKIALLDYALVDRSVMETRDAVILAAELFEKRPAGLVLITSFSNQQQVSHGAFVGDNSALNWVETEPAPPVLYALLEDLGPAGITSWDDLARVESARLTWDADVQSPATSGNLIARIPGADPSRAMILGAHIDSPNTPGALDDGSGSAILWEIARVLDASQTQPPTDLYLAWFGSEELGLYGASNFVATHQELLDRTVAMQQFDMLSRPLDGLDAQLSLVTWSYGHLGDGRLLWPDYLAQAAADQGIEAHPQDIYHTYSDNSTFGGFGVPHSDLIYEPLLNYDVSIHYASHIHDPYDRVELVREMGDVFEEMVRVALVAALEPPANVADVRVAPRPDRRAVFVGSHTEAAHMTPVTFTELGMALALEGFDVDLVPYGQALTSEDLTDADLVIVLPVHDFPGPESDPTQYDEAWTEDEVAVLEAYAADGGLLVLTNSAHRLKYGNRGLDLNEDWEDVNALASQFGITYQDGLIHGDSTRTEGKHPLLNGIRSLELGEDNGIPFSVTEGQVLAQTNKQPVVVLLDYGDAGGQVLVLADVGILTTAWGKAQNLDFWQNLARYARE